MGQLHVVLLLFVNLFTIIKAEDATIVKTEEGKLRGKFMKSKFGRNFLAFQGVPYAEPPIGKLRFEPPVPIGSWDGIKEATEVHAVCPQRDIYRRVDIFEGVEDCLYLNVYTPKVNQLKNSKKLLPVMFFLHGGGWLCGSGNSMWYGPSMLMDKDVVLVVPNYRLGALGFLSTGDLVVPGNNGLKDQNLALKWTKRNIKHFGGDPDSITVFGESAGGAATHFHMLSPMSKDLIHRGISQSGTALVSWAIAPNGQGIRQARKLAKSFNCTTRTSEEMVECLRKIEDPLDIVKKDVEYMYWDFDPMIPFKPTIEPIHENAFLSEHPADTIRSGKGLNAPWMTGLNKDDGALRSAGIFGNPHLVEELDKDFDRVVPISLLYDQTANNVDFVSKQIRKFYFGDKKIDESCRQNVTNMYTDSWFLSGADDAVKLHKKYTKNIIYVYLFSHRGVESFTQIFGDAVNDYGVCHADELQYLFPVSEGLWPNSIPSEEDVNVSKLMIDLWTNFAKTGEPTPELNKLIKEKWEPVQSEDIEYYNIRDIYSTKMEKRLLYERAKFWRELPTDPRKNLLKDEL